MPNSPSIQSSLDDLRQQLRGAVAARLAWGFASAVIGAFWIGLVLDRWLEPSPQVRGIVWIGLLIALLAWLACWAAPRLTARIDDRSLASLLGMVRPELADPVATAIDLRGETDPLADATRGAAERALSEAGEIRIVRPKNTYAAPTFATIAVVAALAITLIEPASVALYAKRIAMSPDPWPRRVLLVAEGFRTDPESGRLQKTVVRGEPCEVLVWADLSGDHIAPRTVWARRRTEAEWLPAEAFTRVGRPIDGRQPFRLRLDDVGLGTELRVSGGDSRLPPLELIASPRPTITDLQIEFRPPGYLGQPASRIPVSASRPLPEGSTATIRGVASQPLSSVTATATEIQDPLIGAVEEAVDELAERFVLRLPMLMAATRLEVTLVDKNQISNVPPFALPIDITPDAPPTVELRLNGIGRAATRDATLECLATVGDDHDVDGVTLVIRPESESHEANSAVQSYEIDAPIGGVLPTEVELSADLLAWRSESADRRFSVNPGDRVALQARVADRYDLTPREPSWSEPITIEIVTPQELLARVGEREAELRATLEGVLGDARRLAYEIDLLRRREQAAEEDAPRLANWNAERLLEARKTLSDVEASAESVASLRREVINNRLDKPSLVERLRSDVAEPLRAVASGPLSRLVEKLERRSEDVNLGPLAAHADEAVTAIEAVIEQLEARETYNEVVAMLRGLIREQRRVNDRTESERRAEARRLLLD